MTWDKIFSSLDIVLYMDQLLLSVLLMSFTTVNYVLSECHRIRDWVKLEVISGNHLVQEICIQTKI